MISDDQSVMLLKAEGILLPYGKSIVEAAQFYAEHHERTKNSRAVDDAFSDFLDAMKADCLSARYQKDCKNHLGRLQKTFGTRPVASCPRSRRAVTELSLWRGQVT